MHRILRKIAAGEIENLDDISTLADPTVVELLRQKINDSLSSCSAECNLNA